MQKERSQRPGGGCFGLSNGLLECPLLDSSVAEEGQPYKSDLLLFVHNGDVKSVTLILLSDLAMEDSQESLLIKSIASDGLKKLNEVSQFG
jgi:hypothetical protein